jgi:hypothetical protein
LPSPRWNQLGDDVGDADPHRPPVVNRGTYIAQNFFEGLRQFLEHAGIGLLRDLQVHDRFGGGVSGGAVIGNIGELPRRAALGLNDGVNNKVDRQVPLVQLRGDRIDQKRHVVIDDFDDCMAACPTVFFPVGVEDADLGGFGFAGLGKLPQRRDRTAQAIVSGLCTVQRGYVGEKQTGKPLDIARLFPGAAPRRADDLIDQFQLFTVIIIGHRNPQTDVGAMG